MRPFLEGSEKRMNTHFDLMSMVNGIVLVAAACSILGGMVLKIAAGWVILVDVHYLKAVSTVFIAFAINFALAIPLDMLGVRLAQTHEYFHWLGLLTIPIGGVIQSIVIYLRFDTSYGYSVLITLAMVLIGFILAVLIGFGFVAAHILF